MLATVGGEDDAVGDAKGPDRQVHGEIEKLVELLEDVDDDQPAGDVEREEADRGLPPEFAGGVREVREVSGRLVARLPRAPGVDEPQGDESGDRQRRYRQPEGCVDAEPGDEAAQEGA